MYTARAGANVFLSVYQDTAGALLLNTPAFVDTIDMPVATWNIIERSLGEGLVSSAFKIKFVTDSAEQFMLKEFDFGYYTYGETQ